MKNKLATLVAVGVWVAFLCAPIASADTKVFGQADARVQYTGGNTKIGTGGTYVGIEFDNPGLLTPNEDGTGYGPIGVFGTLSADLDPKESSLSTIVQTRDAFVGVEYDRYKISLGKMPNLQRNISDGVLDIFAQGTSPTSRHATRNSNTAKVNVRVTDNLNVVSAIVMDGKDGNKKLDSWELGNSYSLGAINIVSAYAKNENTGVRTIIGGATTTFKSVTVGGIYEQDKDTSTSVTTDTINLVAALKLGDQTLKGGFSTVERGDETYLAEVSHDFSTNASAYVGTKHTSGLEDASYTVGFRYSF